MRLTTIIYLLIFCAGCSTTKSTSKRSIILNGSWTPIHQEIGGKELPTTVFQKQRLIISDSLYTFSAESLDKGALIYKGGKMDIYGKEGVNTGKHFAAIYKLEEGKLTICYNLKGDTYPLAFETKSQPMFFLSIFNKD
jgi:uncharacterized protein (TIGR03067 family)